MLICRACGKDASLYMKSWRRKNGKIDRRCSYCGSKLKPIEDVSSHLNKYLSVDNCVKSKKYCDDKSYKKILFLSDLHCGAKSGLTPPEYFVNNYDRKWREIQEESWEFFSETINNIGYVDAVVVNGDAIDGKGSKSGGTELITTDLFKQVDITKRCLEEVVSNKYYFTYGTRYHVGSNGDDFEVLLADKFDSTINSHLWLDVNCCVFDIKHKISGTSVLPSRPSGLIKEFQWNREWVSIHGEPKGDVFIRGHVHSLISVTDHNNFLGMTLPALQVADTKFGSRECSGTVNFGFVLFEVPNNYKTINDLKYTVYQKNLESTRSKSFTL